MSDKEDNDGEFHSEAPVIEENAVKAFQLKSDRAFVSFFKSLPVDNGVLRLFDRKSFHTAHGSDAILLSERFFKSANALKCWEKAAGTQALEYVVLRDGAEMRSALKLAILTLHMRIEIYSYENNSRWELVKRGSPGSVEGLGDDILCEDVCAKSAPVAAAVSVSAQASGSSLTIGIAALAQGERQISVAEFVDEGMLANLECALLQLGVREVYLPTTLVTASGSSANPGSPEKVPDTDTRLAKRLNNVLLKCNCAAAAAQRSDYNTKDVEQDIATLCGTGPQAGALLMGRKCATEAFSCLVLKLGLLHGVEADENGAYELKRVDLAQYMRLDSAAQRALNLVPSFGSTSQGSAFAATLFGLLDVCRTPMGSRRLLRWTKQPLVDLAAINRRLDVVQMLVDHVAERQGIRDVGLKGLGDIDRLCRKLSTGKATLQDCVILYDASAHVSELVAQLADLKKASEEDGYSETLLEEMFGGQLSRSAGKLKKYQAMIEHLVDLDKAEKEHVYEINTTWSPELAAIDQKRKRVYARMEKLALQAESDLFIKQVKLIETSQWGWVLRITKADEKRLREGAGKRYVALDRKGAGSASGGAGIRFTCPELREMSSAYSDLADSYAATSKTITDKLLQVARTYVRVFEAASDSIADIDVLASLAHVSSARGYNRPVLLPSGSGRIVLMESRHPCVEAAALSGDAMQAAGVAGGDFVPNDVVMNKEDARMLLVTGPNMGGKSTYIRQVGVIVVMAQMGCFVPCSFAEISVVDAVLCRVGAGDCQIHGVSTFMAEMLETSAILAAATENSLVIIDELGRGTSTHDGFGLACAITEHICQNIKCFAFFATHFHELTQLDSKIKGIKNLHVTANTVNGKLVLKYKVQDGACDRSFGIHVAELANFPESVLAVARQKAAELEDFSSGPPPAQRQKLESGGEGQLSSLPEPIVSFLKAFGAIDAKSKTDEALINETQCLVDKFLTSAPSDVMELVNASL